MANFKWDEATDGDKLQEKYGFIKVKLLNDFEACGYSSYNFHEGDTVSLNHPDENLPEFDPLANVYQKYILVGPGTGLGVAGVTKKYFYL